VVYRAYELLKEGGEKDPAVLFETAMQNVGPTMEVRSRRVGGANYQVPVEVRAERRRALALRWIVGAARGKKGKPMHVKLAEEIKLGAEGQGEAIAKRDNTHKMAEANKAFAHFAW
ncbi:MAG: 30S ribosomal protein S7, partial [Minisyncoccia bacterium]